MENEIISYLTFNIGGEVFAANVKNIENIIEHTNFTKMPEMPSWLLGVINLRGSVLPVIDSRIKLGFPVKDITSKSCIVVFEVKFGDLETKVGMLVDEVSEVLEIENESIKEPPSIGKTFKADIINGVYSHNDKFVMLLDIQKIILTEEILKMAKAS